MRLVCYGQLSRNTSTSAVGLNIKKAIEILTNYQIDEIPSLTTLRQFIIEMGVCSDIQLVHMWEQNKQISITPFATLHHDGTQMDGKTIEGTVHSFPPSAKNDDNIVSLLAGLKYKAQGTAATVLETHDEIMSTLKQLCHLTGVDAIPVDADFASIISDHADVPQLVAKLFEQKVKELNIFGCGNHKGINLCAAMCSGLDVCRPDGVGGILQTSLFVAKLIAMHDKQYNMANK